MTGRTLRLALIGVVGLVAVGAASWTVPAGADAPVRYGWWYEANAGLPVAPPPPPQVPSDGMYVEKGVNGPAAIAAVTFSVPDGSALGRLVLHIAGSPSISKPPVACALDPASTSYKPAEEGTWSSRPLYDCAKSQEVGTVDAGKTTVTFDADPFLHDGAVSAVILAGGTADQIAFAKPGADGLVVTPPPSAADVNAAASPSDTTGGSSPALPADTSSGFVPGALVAGATGGLGSTTGSLPAPSATANSAGSRSGAAATSTGAGPTAAATVTHPAGWRHHVAEVLGVLVLLGVLVAWSEGYGILGGRIEPLTARRRSQADTERA